MLARVSSEPVLPTHITDQMENIVDIREYDVPYHVRVAIDNKLNVGHWYRVKGHGYDPPEIHLVDDEPDRPVSHLLSVCACRHIWKWHTIHVMMS